MHSYGELAAQHRTGNCRVRIGLFGKVILQVEVRSPKPLYPAAPPPPGAAYDVWSRGSYTFWRDAVVGDVLNQNGMVMNAPPPPADRFETKSGI